MNGHGNDPANWTAQASLCTPGVAPEAVWTLNAGVAGQTNIIPVFVSHTTGAEAAAAFLKRLRLWTLGESLGSVKSLLCQPATMTHASVEPEVRKEAGIEDGLLRLSVGIEEADDLIADLAQALDAVSATSLVSARKTARTA